MDALKPEQIDHVICHMSQFLKDGELATTGVVSLVPMLAILLAQRTHAPHLNYINCIGTFNPSITQTDASSETVQALKDKEAFISLTDLFDLAVKGRIDCMFFSAGQIDRAGNLNLSGIGDFSRPRVKLGGPAGSSVMMKKVHRPVVHTWRHTHRTFVPVVDFVTAYGLRSHDYLDIITDLGIVRLGQQQAEIRAVHPWATEQEIRDQTGFDLALADQLVSFEPSQSQLSILQDLDPRGNRYHV